MSNLVNLVITRRTDGQQSILEHGITEAQAERMCEQWGWMYDDGKHSYYMGYENLKPMKETVHPTYQKLAEIETTDTTLNGIFDAIINHFGDDGMFTLADVQDDLDAGFIEICADGIIVWYDGKH